MKKSTQPISHFKFKILFLSLLFAAFGALTIKAETLKLDSPYNYNLIGNADYEFTPESDGVLTLTIEGEGLYTFSSPLKLNGEEVPFASENGGFLEPATIMTWKLTAHNNYIFNANKSNNDFLNGSFLFTFSGGGTDPDPEPGGDDNTIQLNTPFTAPAASFGQEIPVYVFNCNFTGVLKIQTNQWQKMGDAGQTAWFFFSDPDCIQNMTVADIISDDYSDGYAYLFNVESGNSYYLRNEEWNAITFTFTIEEGEEESNLKTIEPKVTYPVGPGNPLIGVFTAPYSGDLNIEFSMENDDIAFAWDNILFKDENFSQVIVPDKSENGIQFYNVTGGSKYYINTEKDQRPYDYLITLYMADDAPDNKPTVDFITIEENHVYTVTDENPLYGKFTPEKNGSLKVTFTKNGVEIPENMREVLFSDENMKQGVNPEKGEKVNQQIYPNLTSETTYYVKVLKEYLGEDYEVVFEMTYIEEPDQPKEKVTVNIGTFPSKLWQKDGVDYSGYITHSGEADVNLNITFEPAFEIKTAPQLWTEECELNEWEWAQKDAIKNRGNNVDGYYTEPFVERYFDDFNSLNLNVIFGCSGAYKIQISANNTDVDVEYNGETVQYVQILPSIKNEYNYTLGNTEFSKDGITINGIPVNDIRNGSLEMDYPIVNDEIWPGSHKDGLAKSTVIIPGLYLADVYYKVESLGNSGRRAARRAAPSEFTPLDGNYADLSDLTTDNPVQLSLYIEKNGVHTGDAETADYTITLNPKENVATGIETIGSEEAQTLYFDLNGCRVNPENLNKGIYIVKKGNQTFKVRI